MTPRKTAGTRLQDHLNAALKDAAADVGKLLEWTHQELVAIDRAVKTADRAEVIRSRFDALAANPETPATLLNQLSAELRLLDRQVVDLTNQVSPDPGPRKSQRHQKAAQTRWGRSV